MWCARCCVMDWHPMQGVFSCTVYSVLRIDSESTAVQKVHVINRYDDCGFCPQLFCVCSVILDNDVNVSSC